MNIFFLSSSPLIFIMVSVNPFFTSALQGCFSALALCPTKSICIIIISSNNIDSQSDKQGTDTHQVICSSFHLLLAAPIFMENFSIAQGEELSHNPNHGW